MEIGNRLRLIREFRQLSQGDIESRTGLLKCYISRVENGHTVPAVETLEKFARALEVPVYALFYSRAEPAASDADFGASGLSRKDIRFFRRLSLLLGNMGQDDRKLFLAFAKKLVARRPRRNNSQ